MERYLGLDLGTKSLGIAISDSLGLVHPRENFRFPEKAYQQAIDKALEYVEKEGIKVLVLGYPLALDGTINEAAQRSLRFKEELEKRDASLTIHLFDERFSTKMASYNLHQLNLNTRKQKKFIDASSASIILEGYIARKEYMGDGN